MTDTKIYFEEKIEEFIWKDEQRDRALEKNTGIYYDLLEEIDYAKKCQYVVFILPSHEVSAFQEGIRNYHKRI